MDNWWYWWSLLIPDHLKWVDNRWYWWSLLIPDHLKWVDKRWYWWSLLYSWSLQMGALIWWYWWSLHAYSWSLWWYWWSLLIYEHSTWFHKNNKNTMVKLVPHPGHWDCISLMMFVQPFTHVLWDFSLWVVVAFISFWHVVSFPPWVPASSLSKAPSLPLPYPLATQLNLLGRTLESRLRMCSALGYDFSVHVWSVMHVHMYCTQRSRECSKAVATKYDSLVTMVR